MHYFLLLQALKFNRENQKAKKDKDTRIESRCSIFVDRSVFD
jgi:hypothetical protein